MPFARTVSTTYLRYKDQGGLEAGLFLGFQGSRAFYSRREFVFAFTQSDGVREFDYRGARRRINHRGLVVLQAGEPYTVRLPRPLDVSWLAIDASVFRKVNPKASRLPYFPALELDDPQLLKVAEKLHRAMLDAAPLAQRERLLTELVRRALQHAGSRPLGRKSKRKPEMIRARDHMQESLSRPVPLTELAGMTGLSVFQFVRSFSREIGLTPHALLIQMRAQRARELLRRGVSATEASEEAGFSDPSHLVRHFKRIFRLTPGAYAASVQRPPAQASRRARASSLASARVLR